MKILIPGAGNKILHIKAFKELKDVKKIIITDIYPWTFGGMVADAAYITPRFDSPDFEVKIDEIFKREEFDYIFPIHDFALYYFSKNYLKYRKKPYKIAMNKIETINIISDKKKIHDFFRKIKLKTPNTYLLKEFLNTNKRQYPYFIKPRFINMRGTDKQLFAKIEDDDDLNYAKKKLKDNYNNYIIQEYLNGKEINIDIFCDKNGELRNFTCLYRLEMGKNRGIIRGQIIEKDDIFSLIEKITKNIDLEGANQIQAYEQEDEYIFTEINGRFSGSSVFVKEAGVNYFKYYIKMLMGEKIEIKEKAKKLKMSSWEKPFFYTRSKFKTI